MATENKINWEYGNRVPGKTDFDRDFQKAAAEAAAAHRRATEEND